VTNASWPVIDPSTPLDTTILASVEYLRTLLKTVRSLEAASLKKKKKGDTYDPNKPKAAKLFIAKDFPVWQEEAIALMKEHYEPVSIALQSNGNVSHTHQRFRHPTPLRIRNSCQLLPSVASSRTAK
jgi:hypothetical protein